MPSGNYLSYFTSLTTQTPQAYAIVRGNHSYPNLYGEVRFAPDDFTSQPAGNSGSKIACGTIVAS